MDIRLFVTKQGQLALSCHDGAFQQPVESVQLDYMTTMMSIRLRGEDEAIELNCPVHQDVIDLLQGQSICTIGFYLQQKLAGAMFVPFHMTNLPGSGGYLQ